MPTKEDFDKLSPADFMDQVEMEREEWYQRERDAFDYDAMVRESDGNLPDLPDDVLLRQWREGNRRRSRRELWTRTVLFSLVILAFVGLVMVWSCDPASAHSWYDFACCNESDCRQTAKGEVERRDDGWFVVPTRELIPFDSDQIKHSMDPLIHRCVFKAAVDNYNGLGPKRPGDTRCLYVPDVAG